MFIVRVFMMFFSCFGKMEFGKFFLRDKLNCWRYDVREYWYMEFIVDILDNMKNKIVFSLVVGL